MTERPLLLLLVAWAIAIGAQAGDIDAETAEAAKPWTSLTANDAPDDFSFVVVSDRTGGHRPGVFRSAMPKINLLEPAFVLSVGDLIEGYTDDRARLDAEWDEFEGFIAALEVPFFYTPGNHDMSNAVMSDVWRARFGPSYYHFVYKGVLFLVLNSELFGMVGNPAVPVPGPWAQADQMRYLTEVLQEHAGARWTVVLIHQPLWDSERVHPDWERVEALLGERRYTVFAGHYHRYKQSVRHDRNFITLATTGGGSSLRGPLFGEFDHVALVTMTTDGPTIANLTLDGILADDVATAESRAVIEGLSGAVAAERAFFDSSRFRQGEVTYRVRNPGEHPLVVSARATGTEHLAVTGPEPITVPAGAAASVRVNLKAARALAFEDLTPARITWSLASELNDAPVRMNVDTPVLPLRRFPLRRAPAGVRVDGDVSEWRLPFAVTRQGDIASPQIDPDDISFRFGVGWDADRLYLAASVVDDSIVASGDRTALEQDALVVTVDARPEPARWQNERLEAAAANGSLASMAVQLVTLAPEKPSPILSFLDEVRAEIRSAVQRTPGGYGAELSVPAALLDARQGEPWQEVRLGIHANDFDAGEAGFTVLHWQPYRFGSAPLTGTGAFVRR